MQQIGPSVMNGTVAFHRTTGSDTTSGFMGSGRGQGEDWKCFKTNTDTYGKIALLRNEI